MTLAKHKAFLLADYFTWQDRIMQIRIKHSNFCHLAHPCTVYFCSACF